MNRRRVLFLYTASYPYGLSEEFFHEEYKVLVEKFDEVVIFPTFQSNGLETRDEVTSRIVNAPILDKDFVRKNLSIHEVLKSIKLVIADVLTNPYPLRVVRYLKRAFLHSFYHLKLADLIREELVKYSDSEVLHYSHWGFDAVMALGILKKKREIVGYFFRVLGTDYQEVQRSPQVIFNKKIAYKYADDVYPNSLEGLKLISEQFPELKENFEVQYLATKDMAINEKKDFSKLVVLSCARVYENKRVHKIPEILNHINAENIIWIHRGDGELLDHVQKLANNLPSSIKTIFLPFEKDINQLYKFYSENDANVFLHLSRNEGLPVVLQEAASAGIPIVCTPAGGSEEVVEDGKNGFVVPMEFNAKEVAYKIELLQDQKLHTKMALHARKKWELLFSANSLLQKI